MGKKVELNDSDKAFCLLNAEKLSLKEMAQQISGDPNQNGQTVLGRAIRSFLASQSVNYKTTKYEKIDSVVLDDDQKEFIQNNAGRSRPLELAKLLFNDTKITNLDQRYKAVYEYVLKLDPDLIKPEERDLVEEYKSPTSIQRLIPRVNKYVMKNMGEGLKFLDPDNLKAVEQKNLESLLGYMNVFQFTYQIGLYKKNVDVELFESNFIRFCYDKHDLLEEEVNDYIALCAEIVLIAQSERRIQGFDYQVQELMSGDNNSKKLSMTFVEAIKNEVEKLNQAKTKRDKLKDNLIGARTKRIDSKITGRASLHSFVEIWKKSQADRRKIISMAKQKQEANKKEVERLTNIDALKAEIYGIDPNSIIK